MAQVTAEVRSSPRPRAVAERRAVDVEHRGGVILRRVPRPLVDAWHRDALAAVGRWSWLQDLNDRVTAAVDPVYDRHRDDLLLELMHGGRWVGHSLHPAGSDLPIGLWSSILVLDLAGEDAPGNAGGASAPPPP